MEKWIEERLSNCLDFPVPEDLVQYIISIENSRDLEEYLRTLLDFENANHRSFVTELVQKKKQLSNQSANTSNADSSSSSKSNSKKKYKPLQALNQKSPSPEKAEQGKDVGGGKKKQKFVNLYSQEGQNKETILLKGRHHCDCQASKHKLINNCVQCGRVICLQEGSGPCLFCGNLVCSPEEQQILNSQTKKSDTLYNKLIVQKRPEGWEAALAQRNRLLEYDRTSERRTRVTDDDSDYFNSGSVWLNKAERVKLEKYEQSLREKKHASRFHKTFTLDFAGRQIIEEPNFAEVNEQILRDITEQSAKSNHSNVQKGNDTNYDGDIHPGFIGPAPQFDMSIKSSYAGKASGLAIIEGLQRLQDAPLQEIGDRGLCLSMHQPWASLLVAGIKIHEGRSWYTSHRGRLWIASTAQPPDDQSVRSMENMYTLLYPDEKLNFPKTYPTGCLLGCVTVGDCLGQEEYRSIYPKGESESPFVFICSDPRELMLKFPIKGKHKIYSLDSKIHQAAVKSMQKLSLVREE